MQKINGFTLQEKLLRAPQVTLAWVQATFSLSYGQALQFLREAMRRGWLERECVGVEYIRRPENMRLRHLRRQELEELVNGVRMEESKVLCCISEKDGATQDEIRSTLRLRNRLSVLLDTLLELGLVYCFEDTYFCCVSRRSVELLDLVCRTLYQRTQEGSEELDDDLLELFDELFEDGE